MDLLASRDINGDSNPKGMHFPDTMDDCDNPMVASAQRISECASLLPPLSPQSPTEVNITDSSDLMGKPPPSYIPSSGSVTLLVPMNGPPITPKPGEKVFIENVPQISTTDGIKLLIPVKGPSKHGETIFIKNAPNPGGPVFLIPSQTDPNEKVLVPATSQQGGNSGAIILVPQPKPKSSKQNSETMCQPTTRKKQRQTRNFKDKDERKARNKKLENSPCVSGKNNATATKPNFRQLTVTKTTCIPAIQRQPLILGDRARQMYEKNVTQLKTVIKAQKRKIQKQQRDLDRLRQEKKEGVKHLPKKHLCKLIKKHLPGYVGQFIEAQLINYGVEVKNKHRWEMSDKVFALAMWHRSPLAYKLLRETFAMPSVKTLQHWTATVPPDLDFYDVLKELVKKKLPQDHEDDDDEDDPEKERIETIIGKPNSENKSVELNNDNEETDTDTVIESDNNNNEDNS